MQIMNLDKFSKNLWWALTAYKTIDELPDAVIFVGFKGEIKHFNKKAQELFALGSDDFTPANIIEGKPADRLNICSRGTARRCLHIDKP